MDKTLLQYLKKIGLILMGVLLALIISAVLFKVLFFPRHPWSWYRLERRLPRSEVLALLDAKKLTLIKKDFENPIFFTEIWRKQYWFGHWDVECIYDPDVLENLQLVNAGVDYESYVFPNIKRRRTYGYPPVKPPLLD